MHLLKVAHGVMEVYSRENVPTINNCYVKPLCNKSRDPFSPKDVVLEGQMFIVHSRHQDYVTLLGRENVSVY